MARNRKQQPLLRRRGAIVVLVAVCLTMVLAFVAIAIDGGGLLEQRRQAQATADAAALAAAEDLFRNYPAQRGADVSGTAADAAYAIAAANGFNDDNKTNTVTVRLNPQNYFSGPKAGQTVPKGYVEVTVQRNQQRYFSAVLGTGTLPVPARAVARGKWEPAYVGIHVLDLFRPSSLYGNGNATVTVKGAKIIVNSNAPDAATSNGLVITGDDFKITGGTAVTAGGAFIGPIQYGTPPEPDPLRHIPEPDINGQTVQSAGPVHFSNGQRTLSPGTYRGGISVSGKGSLTLQPGIYYMDGGGFSFTGQGDLYAPGVMIFNAPTKSSEVVSISGTGSITMSPPQDGVYKGLTLFQDRESGNTMSVSGGGAMDIKGTFYTANGTLDVGGGGAGQIGSQYVSRFLSIRGNGTLNIDYDPTQAIPRRILSLVE